MTYTIKELANLAGVTPRTLRHYHQLGLLLPAYLTEAGYRIYTQVEIDKLQHILFYRELAVPLEQIKDLLTAPTTDSLTLLAEHRQALLKKQKHLTHLIATIDQTIASEKGEKTMTNEEKFTAFKTDLIQKNDAQYGQVTREAYGEEAVKTSQAALLKMTESDYQKLQSEEQTLLTLLATNLQLTVPSDLAEKIFQLHKNWVSQHWGSYNAEAYRGLGQMYLDSPEFTAYYDDKAGTGATVLLNTIIQYYA